MGGEYRFLEVGRKLNSPLGFPHLGGEVRTLHLGGGGDVKECEMLSLYDLIR